jgi:hypothetical protein
VYVTRWESPIDLEDILGRIAKGVDGDSVPLPKGYALDQIAEREKSMDWPIPQEIRTLYHWFTPLRWKAAIRNKEYENALPAGAPSWFTNPYLMPLERTGWKNRHSEDISKEIKGASESARKRATGWETSFNFCFAATSMGEEIVYCLNPPELNRGLITCWCEMPLPGGLLLGNSLAHWLARFHDCGNREYALAIGTIDVSDEEKELDNEPGLDDPLRNDFLQDHLRLNPNDEYARGLLSRKFWD